MMVFLISERRTIVVNIDGFTSFYKALYVTKRVIEREQSIMGTIFFIFKVNTVEKALFQ